MASENHVSVAGGNSKFARKFYEALSSENKDKNLFFSPISAHAILALLYQGAAGTTAKDFSEALHVSDKTSAADGYKSIITALDSVDKVILHLANKVYIKNNFPLKENFSQTAKTHFLSEIESVNFEESTKTAKIINNWVEAKTNSKIKDLVSADTLNYLTRLVLVNAVYFKGNWAHKFSKASTKTQPFYVSNNAQVHCQMMRLTRYFFYKESKELDAKILELPYDNEEVSMVIILPNQKFGIDKLESKLLLTNLDTLTDGMMFNEVEVSLPRFTINTSMDLKSNLEKMGLGVIFVDGLAEFSEISDSSEQLVVSKAIQKAFIEVNEDGAEAAAAIALQFLHQLTYKFLHN